MKAAMSWYHLGLRGRLFTAFGVVAALTVLASSSAIISYGSLGRSIGAIAEKSLPERDRRIEEVAFGGGELPVGVCLESAVAGQRE